MITRRAWGYLAIVLTRHLVTALFIIAIPGDIKKADAFKLIRSAMPLDYWAWIFLAIAAVVGVGMALSNETICRIGLTLSAAATGSWAIAFVATIYYLGVPPSPMLPIAWCALLLKDLVISSGPLQFQQRTVKEPAEALS